MVVTIQDEAFEHIVPFRRQIRVVDMNDNAPTFVKNVYEFNVDETVEIGVYNFKSLSTVVHTLRYRIAVLDGISVVV